MTNAIEKAESKTIATVRVQAMRTALDEESAIRGMVKEYVNRHMVAGTDYGVIPGTEKPSLLKPGAQKLISLFRCTPTYKLVASSEDFDTGLFSYTFRVRLVSRDTKEALAEGYGSANSREGRYRWRNAARKCPHCAKETIIKGKKEYGGGWLCFAKKGGCGAKFGDGDQSIEGQEQGQVENDDIATLANTILKMAKKRAEVDGAIALAHCADMFTQDMEDLEDTPVMAERTDTQQQAAPQQQQVTGKKSGTARVREQLSSRTARTREPEAAPEDDVLGHIAAEFDMTKARVTLRAQSVLGKTSGFTPAEIVTLRDTLRAIPKTQE